MDIPENLYQQMLPQLEKIEKIRKPYLFFKKAAILSILLPILSLIFYAIFLSSASGDTAKKTMDFLRFMIQNPSLPSVIFFGFSFLPIPLAITTSILYQTIAYRQMIIISELLRSINEKISFDSKKQLSKEYLLQSHLFTALQNKNNYGTPLTKGFGKGTIENIQIEFADITILGKGSPFFYIPGINIMYLSFLYLKQLFSSKEDIYVSGFRGLFFKADFPKSLRSKTLIFPDKLEEKIGFLAKSIQQLKHVHGELVYLENPHFEKEFVVYSTDQIEARYVLSPRMMEKILAFRQKIQRPLLLSFQNSQIYIVIEDPNGIFELQLKKNVLNPESLENLYLDIGLCTSVVKELSLGEKF